MSSMGICHVWVTVTRVFVAWDLELDRIDKISYM